MSDRTKHLTYGHPTHEEFNKRFEAKDHTPRDPASPWLDYAILPSLRGEFHAHQQGQPQDDQTITKQTQPVIQPKPPASVRKVVERQTRHEQWLLEERNAVLAQASHTKSRDERSYEHQPMMQEPSQGWNTNPTKRSNSMSTENNNQGPLQAFENGATRIKIWEQQANGKSFATASVGKVYKDKGGEWREGRSFNATDLQKLQEILPDANKEMVKWQEYYHEVDHQNAPEAPRRDLAAERDAVMQAARENEQNQAPMQEPEHLPSQEPQR